MKRFRRGKPFVNCEQYEKIAPEDYNHKILWVVQNMLNKN